MASSRLASLWRIVAARLRVCLHRVPFFRGTTASLGFLGLSARLDDETPTAPSCNRLGGTPGSSARILRSHSDVLICFGWCLRQMWSSHALRPAIGTAAIRR